MSGRLRRSRACETCRTRRKGCDQGRPSCGQCLRSGLVCRGYNDDELPVLQYRHAGHGHSRYTLQTGPPELLPRPPSPSRDVALTDSATIARVFNSYSEMVFPSPRDVGIVGLEDNHSTSVLFYLLRTQPHTALVMSCLEALASSALAHQENEEDTVGLRERAMASYSTALTTVNQLLQSDEGWRYEKTLAACRLLAMYEAHSGSLENCEKHMIGLEGMMLMRGAAQHVDGIAHEVFLDARLQVALLSLRLQRHSSLANQEWRTVPWTVHAKSLRHSLLDIMFKAASLLAELKAIRLIDCGPERDRLSFEWLAQCVSLLTALSIWEQDVIALAPDRVRPFFARPIPATCSVGLFSLTFNLFLYWTVQVVCRGFLDVVSQDMSSHSVAYLGFEPSSHANAAETFATNILLSAEYVLQDNAGVLLPAMYSVAAHMALGYFAMKYETVHPTVQAYEALFSDNAASQLLRNLLVGTQDRFIARAGILREPESASENDRYTRLRATFLAWYGVTDSEDDDTG